MKRFDRSPHSSVVTHDRHQDQRAAHGRRAGLGEVRLRPVVAHRLADLVGGELADHVGPEDQRHRERGEAGEHRAQRDVVEDVEQRGCPWRAIARARAASVPSLCGAGERGHDALHLHEPRALDQDGLAVACSRTSSSDALRNAARRCRKPRPCRASLRRSRAAASHPWRARTRRPRGGTRVPCSPTSPMSPSTSAVGGGHEASTSIAARTESGLAL